MSSLRALFKRPAVEPVLEPETAEIEEAWALAEAEESNFSLAEHLPVLLGMAARRERVLSAVVDERRGSVHVTFESAAYTFAVADLYQAKCLAASCRISNPQVFGVAGFETLAGAVIAVSASPWSIFLDVNSARRT